MGYTVELYFEDAEQNGFNDKKISCYRTKEKGHGCIGERIYYYSTDVKWMEAYKEWPKLSGIGKVIRRTQTKGEVTEERVYHIAGVKTVEDYARGVRYHWGVESTHRSLDVTFGEDANRTRKGKAPQKLALLLRHSRQNLKNQV